MKRLLYLGLLVAVVLGSVSLITSASPAFAQDDPCPLPDTPTCTHGLPTTLYTKLLAAMTKEPTPNVSQVPIDQKRVDSYTFYKVLAGAVRYDAPNGNPLGAMEEGFNFVSIYRLQDGFAMLKDGAWVPIQALKKTFASEYSGVQFTQPLPRPMAWVIQASIPAEYPGGPSLATNPAIKRYTRVYIYASVLKKGWYWYLVGPGQWLEQRKVAKLEPHVLPDKSPITAAKWVAVDLYEQVLAYYEKDKLIGATLISSGLPPWNTNLGQFTVWQRNEETPMSGSMGQADAYSLPQVPYVLFFDNEISLHGTYWHDGFGYKRSHGCVNMSISDAKWLYQWVGTDELSVVVWDSNKQARQS